MGLGWRPDDRQAAVTASLSPVAPTVSVRTKCSRAARRPPLELYQLWTRPRTARSKMSGGCRVLSRGGRRDVPRTRFTVLGMDHTSTDKPPVSRDPAGRPRFYSVAQAARMIGVSDMTLYRAIAAGEFPAVRIRGRLIIPAEAVEAMAEVAALVEQTVVDAAGWVRGATR